MYNNFSDEYKKLMIDTEVTVKANGYREILPQDVFLEVVRIQNGPMHDLLSTYGIGEKLVLEVFAKMPFSEYLSDREGPYSGLGQRVKDLIVVSVKIAASQERSQAGVDNFALSLFRSNAETWFFQFFDYIGINPKDVEKAILGLARQEENEEPEGNNPFGQLDSLLHALEDGIQKNAFQGGNTDEEGHPAEEDPFAINKKPAGKKEESPTPALDFFGNDLTEEARIGKIDDIIGRGDEIERLISVLNRKTKNNPCLVGEPGVGKTAVVEGLALRISQGKVPFAMQGKRVVSLDLSGLVAGTKYRGEFESRLKQIIDEASKLENEVILFIDEIHTIIGAGSGEGSLDAANILKPAMGRGKICVIGATTLNEYQKYIEKDSALERRFQKIEVDEPESKTAQEIIKGLRHSFEEFHNLVIDDSAIEDAVELSVRYITDRFLPDKAIDLIDEACSAKSMKYNSNEEEVEEIRTQIERLQKDIEGYLLSEQYHKALKSKEKMHDLESKIADKKAKKVIPREKRLHITSEDVQRIVHQITGIPMKNIRMQNREKLKSLEKNLKKRIIGQDAAIDQIVGCIKRSWAEIADRNRPIGSFLFLGPTGVGKTELVKVLADEFFGDPKALIKLDMSEYGDRSSASKLIGTTAGYVGYEEGGMLTEKVRRKPYAIVLFDEIEKGNFDIFHLLLQILEDGAITDGKGRKVNFRNTIIVMTSNIGSEEFTSKAAQIGFSVNETKEKEVLKDFTKSKEKILAHLDEYFSPEFLNRIDTTIVFNPLDKNVLKKIVVLQTERLQERLTQIGVNLVFETKSLTQILKDTFNPEYGARPIRRYIQEKIENPIADILIQKEFRGTIRIDAEKGKFVFHTK